MNDFEQQLGSRMNDRASRVAVTLDLDEIRSGGPRQRTRIDDRNRSGTRLLAAAAAVALLGGGVVALTQFRTVEAPGAAEQPARPAPPVDPYAGLPREGPTLTDHWHVPYGIDVCGEWVELEGDLEVMGDDLQLVNEGFASTGIHSHDDGLIHIHPFGSAGVGANAMIGTFLSNYGVDLTDDSLSFPTYQSDGRQVVESDAACGGIPASLAVIVWLDQADPTNKVIVTEQLAGTPLGADGIVVAVAFTDDPASVEMPPSVADAEENLRIEG